MTWERMRRKVAWAVLMGLVGPLLGVFLWAFWPAVLLFGGIAAVILSAAWAWRVVDE